jgi:hypothetical protein
LIQVQLKPSTATDSTSISPDADVIPSNARTGRKGSITIFEDPTPDTEGRDPTINIVGTNGGAIVSGGLPLAQWQSAKIYKAPQRHNNETELPPAITRDSLKIEEFPMGKISTVWINMVKQGLSEWIKIPVIVARGVQPG